MRDWLEIINPSDMCHIDGTDNRLAASIAIMLLSNGKYALRDREGESVLPIVAFGGEDEYINSLDLGGLSLDDWYELHLLDMAKALETVCYGSRQECESQALALELIDDPEKRQKFIAFNEDSRRSSMTRIVDAAHESARRLRERALAKSQECTI